MENGRKLLRGIALAAIAVIGLGGIALFASPSLAAQTRPDVIRIDAIGQLKKVEMPPAVFLHAEHTKALAATGQDCSVCHTPTANGHTVKFQRKEDGTDAKKLENIYHNGCIGCHENMASNNQKTGPLDGECRACHDTKLPFKAEQKPVKMGSKSLHYLHVSSKAIVNPANSEENCGVCHHVYDEKLNKLVWKKGQEDACAACHGEKAVGSTPSLQTAVHTKCVWCHENVAQSSRAYLTAQVEAKKAAEPKSTKKLSAKEVQAEAAAEAACTAACASLKGCMAKLIVQFPFLRITQDRISLCHILELLLRSRISGVGIRMILLCKFSICSFDFVLGGISRHAQNFIRVSHVAELPSP